MIAYDNVLVNLHRSAMEIILETIFDVLAVLYHVSLQVICFIELRL